MCHATHTFSTTARAASKSSRAGARLLSRWDTEGTETEIAALDRGELEGILAENGVKPRGNTRHTATWRTALRKASCTVKAGGESAPEPEREPEEWAEVEVFSLGRGEGLDKEGDGGARERRTGRDPE
jgi:hypothetical protein